MKKIISLFAILMLMAVATTGYAQVKAGSVHITPTIGMYKFEGSEDMDASIALGLRAGYNFTKYFGVEAFGHWAPTEMTNYDGEKVNFFGYGIEALFHILPDGALVPFVAVGLGGVHYSKYNQDTTEREDNKIAADYGLGVKYFLSNNWALRADVRHVIPIDTDFDTDTMHNNLLATVGLTYAFGGEKPAPPPPPPAPVVLDSDNDGVPDNLDKCPGTPAGVAVDKDGCPLDSDNDGVYDYLDKCPGTPAGVKVDKDGCPPPVVVQPRVEKEIIEKGRTTLKVLFDTNKSVIKKGYFDDVDALAGVMQQYPDLNVTIEGHTDNVGKDAYNKKLSQRRAEAVKAYLVKKGIDANRLTAVGYGEEKPIADNATTAGKAENRRVEAEANYIIKK
jgi:OOP family OmpA-OmpF porin